MVRIKAFISHSNQHRINFCKYIWTRHEIPIKMIYTLPKENNVFCISLSVSGYNFLGHLWDMYIPIWAHFRDDSNANIRTFIAWVLSEIQAKYNGTASRTLPPIQICRGSCYPDLDSILLSQFGRVFAIPIWKGFCYEPQSCAAPPMFQMKAICAC